MSLDVYLKSRTLVSKKGTGVFVRQDGKNVELSIEQVKDKFPNAVINEQEYESEYVFEANITHNLGEMAAEANIYDACWRPYRLHPDYKFTEDYNKEMEFENSHTMYAIDILPSLKKGYEDMEARPEHYKQFDAANGWGKYDNFLLWVREYLEACIENPDAEIITSR